jgi:hypothetical protein
LCLTAPPSIQDGSKEISIFGNSGHFEWRAALFGHNIEKGPPKDHPSQICFNLVQWFQTKNRNFFNCPLLL